MRLKHGGAAPPPTTPQAPVKDIESDRSEFSKPQVLEVVNNRIYFYADIDRDNVLRLNKSLMELDSFHVSQGIINRDNGFRPIYLHINSYGGYVFDALAASDQISLTDCEVYTVVDGICASAATFLSLKGVKRYIKPNSFMLIHQLSSGMWGKYDEFIDEMKNLDKLMDIIKSIYLKNTKLKASKLEEILSHDLYFDAKECIKYGLADEILKK